MNKMYINLRIRGILRQIGEDIDRPGLIETPDRVANMYEEIFKGYWQEPPEVTIFPNGEDGVNYDQMVTDSGYFFSNCEHHMIPFFGDYFFAYIPNKNVLGISKVARVVDHFSSKLQVQERLTQEIAQYIYDIVKPKGLGLFMSGRHLCKEMRGIKKHNSPMTTTVLMGSFKNKIVKEEFLSRIKGV